MPKRTNNFQRVVTAVQRVFAPAGAKITASAMIKGADGVAREVDIWVEFKSGLYSVIVAIEAKDHRRKLDVGTIEQYIGKYNCPGGIMVNAVVIVGRGFSQTAKQRAKTLKFQLQTVESLEKSRLSMFDGPPVDLPKDYKHEPKQEPYRWVLLDDASKEVDARQFANPHLMHRSCGKTLGQLPAFVDRHLPMFRKWVSKARTEHSGCMVEGVLELCMTHIALVHDAGEVPLSAILIKSAKSMVIPKMTAQHIKISSDGDTSFEVIVESAETPDYHIEISYQRPEDGKTPEKMNVQILRSKNIVANWKRTINPTMRSTEHLPAGTSAACAPDAPAVRCR